MYNKLPWKKPKLFRGNCQNHWFLKLFSFLWRGLPLTIKKCLGTSLRASYKGHSGGRAGKGRRACNYVSIKKVDAKCWIAEITLAMIFHVFFNDCLHSHWLAEIWQLSPQRNWRRNSNSRDVVTSSPSFPAPPPERPGELVGYLETFQVGNCFSQCNS